MMKVKLVDVTKDGIDKIARMGRSTKLNDLPEKWDDAWGTQDKFVKSLMAVGHLGILEHITFTFHVSGISRNLTHQLVRHRIASYLQQSNRKVIPKMQDYIIPHSVKDSVVEDKFHEAMVDAWSSYSEAMESGIPTEDARYLLPSGYFTHIAITMNARQLLHFFELRCHKSAQWEIREMAGEMLDICKKEFPAIFEDFNVEKKMSGMELWTIYKHPTDYPDKFVARKWILDKPTFEIVTGDTIEEVRMTIPKGLTRFLPDAKDVPEIVEIWL